MPQVLAFVFRHWKQQRRAALVIVAAMAVATVADLFVPVFCGRMIDAISVPGGPSRDALHRAVFAIAVMAVLGGLLTVARFVAFRALTEFTLKMMSRMAADAFWRVQRLSTDWHASTFAGSTVRRITRGMWAVDLMNDTILLALLPALIVLFGVSITLGFRWLSMGLLVTGAAAVYIAISVSLSVGYVAPAARLSNEQDSRIGAALADAITCNSVVKSFGGEAREEARLARAFHKWRARTWRHWILGTRSGTAQLGILVCLRTLVLLYALRLWWLGTASIGDITFVLTSYLIVHGYLRDIGQHVANLQRSVNEMEELVRIQHEPLGVEDHPEARSLNVTSGGVVFERVTFQYGRHVTPLFEDFSLEIRPGERVGLVGHSGSGKSTFVKLLHRLYEVNGGRILIDRQDIARVTQASLRTQLALVSQEPILFHRSLAENIAYARPDAGLREIEAAADLANAHGFISKQPKGYATLVGERGIKLSGGERQRVALARAFLADSPVLILDEATSSLDAESEAAIQEAMSRLMAGRTSIVIAHRLSTVRMLDRILVFDSGRVVEEGTHESLLAKPDGTYRRLFEKQALGLVSEPEVVV
ncbi:MAG: ABC transporter ATP-binding protein [Acidobacteriaceae bacterium]|nr:ABC transporter ATP-binding protein [Acidobacteriaceae bacterium]